MGEHTDGKRALRGDPAFLREVIANTTEGILTIDTDSVVVYANPAVEGILGYAPDELVGSSMMTMIPERLRGDHERGLRQYLETGRKHLDWSGVELPARHADGHEMPVAVSMREHTYEGERLFTGVFTDISDQKRRERELRERTEELSEFADVLAYDIRRPLANARDALTDARERDDGDALGRIESALTRADAVISDTLARAHDDEAGPNETLAFRETLRAAWDALDVQTSDATLVLPADPWLVRASPERLRALAEQLFENAIEHAGSDVTVTVGVFDDEDGFYVADDGPGFPNGGTGSAAPGPAFGHYGLRVVGRIVNEHGWHTRFTESGSGGACVEVRGVTLVRGPAP